MQFKNLLNLLFLSVLSISLNCQKDNKSDTKIEIKNTIKNEIKVSEKTKDTGDFDENSVLTFPINGWNKWGNIAVKDTNNSILINGDFQSAAGYVYESKSIRYGGYLLNISIKGTDRCKLHYNQIFKLEIDGDALRPNQINKECPNDPDFICGGDGTVSFNLPKNFNKIQFVFWNAKLENLLISGQLIKKE